jgi:3-oxoacyl-[acyl-carrier-protein] synthase-3
MTNNQILATGSYLPERVMTNDDLSKLVDTNDEWITERTGIKERHIASKEQKTSDLAYEAAKKAIDKANIDAQDIDLIIVATTTPDLTFPSTAVIVQGKLGIKSCSAFDIQAVCSGFIYGLTTADSLMKTLGLKKALVIGAETMSRIIDWKDRGTCILFGDGAGAVILEETEDSNKGILAANLYSDSQTKELLYTDGGTSASQKAGHIHMEGREVFKHAVSKLATCTKESLQKANLTTDEIDWVIPHQANQRILDATIKKLRVKEDKLISTVAKHANTSAASIPLALDNAVEEGKVKKGDLLAIQAIGGGLTWGSAIVRY